MRLSFRSPGPLLSYAFIGGDLFIRRCHAHSCFAPHITRRKGSLRFRPLQPLLRDVRNPSSAVPRQTMATSTSTSPTSAPGVPVSSPSSAILPSGVASSDSTAPLSSIAISSTTSPGQSTTTPPITPSSSPVPTTLSSSPSHSPQTPTKSVSTSGSQSSVSSSSAHTSPTNSSNPTSHRLSNGTVAGIVVAVALGIALLTFLLTFFIMRHRQESKRKGRYRSSKDSEGLELKPPRQQDPTSTPKTPFVTEASGLSRTYESYLPQSADDRTIQQKTKATLDQIELHVENFYRNSASSAPRLDNAELAVFDSPYLPASLTSLLPRSKNRINLMKHALAHSVTSSISPSASPAPSLLPTEYGLLPSTVTSARSNVSTKAGEYRFVPSEFTHFQTVANLPKDPGKSCLDGG